MQMGGRGLTEQKIQKAAEAGLTSCGVSLDGLSHYQITPTLAAK